MMKRTFCLAAVALAAVSRPAWAQQDEIARLRAELVNQQAVITQLLQRVDDLEKRQSAAVTKDDLEQEAKTEQDSVNSVRETLLGKVNVSGYYNFRYFNDGSETHNAFQQDHLGLLLGKQFGRFNFFAELELQNAPHHPQAATAAHSDATAAHTDATASTTATATSGEGQVAVENGWLEYTQNRYLSLRVGKQLSPQYWWQNHYPNLTYSTDLPIYLRELFPPELIGVTLQGGAAKSVGASEFGVGYKLYVANNDFEGNGLTDLRDGKAWGGRLQVRFPTSGPLKRLDVAGDVYQGHTGTIGGELADDKVAGFEEQLEVGRFMLNSEYARGRSLGSTRSGFYVQPAVRLQDNWLTFYRVEELESPRLQTAERRHLAGVNYRPFSQVALKLEYYRSVPLIRSFILSDEARKSFNGFATAAVFFF
jgi:hypothetical protein